MSRQRPPDRTGRTVLVTGATSGLGLASARALARAGARVLLGARDPGRGKAALEQVPGGELVELDLATTCTSPAAPTPARRPTPRPSSPTCSSPPS